MSVPEIHWWSVRAGEYVLGTLRGEDRELFEKILASDIDVQNSVTRWERRLAGLNESVVAQTPGDHVWQRILNEIRETSDMSVDELSAPEKTEVTAIPNAPDLASAGVLADAKHDKQEPNASSDTQTIRHEPNASSKNANTVHDIRTATREPAAVSAGWQSMAGFATAASLILGILLFQGGFTSAKQPLSRDGVSVVLSDEDGTPYFLVETDYENLNVRVTALSPPEHNNTQDLQLWQALPDRSGVRPVALLPDKAGVARTFKVESLVEGSDLFGVSIEPKGASTDGGPTGPVVGHGDFLQTQSY